MKTNNDNNNDAQKKWNIMKMMIKKLNESDDKMKWCPMMFNITNVYESIPFALYPTNTFWEFWESLCTAAFTIQNIVSYLDSKLCWICLIFWKLRNNQPK